MVVRLGTVWYDLMLRSRRPFSCAVTQSRRDPMWEGPHGAVYVSNYGFNVATATHPGEILKITGLS